MPRKKKTELIEEPKVEELTEELTEEPKVEKLTEEPKVDLPKAKKPRKLSEVVIPRTLRRL